MSTEDTPTTNESIETPNVQSTQETADVVEEKLYFSKDAFNERLQRAQKTAQEKFLKEHGFNSADEFVAWKETNEKLNAEIEERKRSEMTELEKYKADLEAIQQEKTTLEQQAKQTELEREAAVIKAHLTKLCLDKGIKNTDYAFYKIENALNDLDENDELDEVAFLDKLMENEDEKKALGFSSAPIIKQANTSTKEGPDPKPQGKQEGYDALKASKEEHRARLEALGVYLPGN